VSRRAVEAAADRFVPGFLAPHGEKLQYLAVGAFNTAFGYAVWAALYALLSHRMGYAPILVLSYAIAIANAYAWYRFVVFRSHDSVWRELPRFSAVYLATMIVNLIVFPIAVRRLPVSAYAIQAVFTLGVVVASYAAHKHFSFGGPAGHDRRAG
jgi:putative flippase GtrA